MPPPLCDVALLSLDLGLLQAGVGVKGEFEQRLKGVIDAGGAEGGSDAANLLKPALDRRFQRIQIEEPDENSAVVMLRAVADKLEAHHGVQILDTAIREAVRLSQRYISGRQLPDKAISEIDTACG